MSKKQQTAQAIAHILLSGEWQRRAMVERLESALEGDRRWLQPLIHRVWSQFGDFRRPPSRQLARMIFEDAGFSRAWEVQVTRPRIVRYPLEPQSMEAPLPALAHCALPILHTPQDLADLLGLSMGQLLWFADPEGRLRRITHGPLCHYRYLFAAKSDGELRLLEAPRPRLKRIQRRLLDELLAQVPVHPAAHGFVAGCSCRTAALPHIGQESLIRMDLQAFFPSIGGGRLLALFRALGYPEPVAILLRGLCAHRAPPALVNGESARRGLPWATRNRLMALHLPQGAPTSPALANLCAWRLDCRLAALAERMDLNYTRYADDMAFSGRRMANGEFQRLRVLIQRIVLEEGFALNQRKSRHTGQGGQQRLLGMVVNQRPNIPRRTFDQLKAILTNCVRHGPASQNRQHHPDFRAHLLGRIAHVRSINDTKGENLMTLFREIRW